MSCAGAACCGLFLFRLLLRLILIALRLPLFQRVGGFLQVLRGFGFAALLRFFRGLMQLLFQFARVLADLRLLTPLHFQRGFLLLVQAVGFVLLLLLLDVFGKRVGAVGQSLLILRQLFGGFGKLFGRRGAVEQLLRFVQVLLGLRLLLIGLLQVLAALRVGFGVLRLLHLVGGGRHALLRAVFQRFLRLLAALHFRLGGEVVVFQLVGQILNALRKGFGFLRHAALLFLRPRHLRRVVFRRAPAAPAFARRSDAGGRRQAPAVRRPVRLQFALHFHIADDVDAERLRTPDVRAAQIVVVPIVHFVADHVADFGSDAADVPALPDVHLRRAILARAGQARPCRHA